ncbi:MAG: hypothetical protein K2P09_04810 [Erysipelotrichales bacterium]|nr:hypothetical protein [Erysipelotrichales bacterium]
MKNKRMIGLGILVIFMCLPCLVFKGYDNYIFHKKVKWKDASIEHQIKEKHPLIQEVNYQRFHSQIIEEEDMDIYSIKRKGEYTKEKQDKFFKIQSLLEKEINKLIQNNILSYENFEMEESNQSFVLPFGTIKDDCIENGTYYLQMIYRIHSGNKNELSFEYNKKTSLITNLSIYSQEICYLSQKDIQSILKNYLIYLGLDDIEDWSWNDYGYESYLAKLQVFYSFERDEDHYGRLDIYLQPYGSYVPYKNILDRHI